jgi:alpha-ribazole phosphatase
MLKIIIVRHGQTDWNREEVFRGQVEIKLNALGIKQAEAVARVIKNIKLDAIYSSPLKRALDTAKIIASYHNIEVKINEGLNDMNFGKWQGLSLQTVKEKYKDLFKIWCDSPHLVKIPQGESLNGVQERVSNAFKQIISEYNQATIVIVSHRVVIKLLLCTILGLDSSNFWKIKQDPGSISIVEYKDDIFTITKLNDTCHLKNIQDITEITDF